MSARVQDLLETRVPVVNCKLVSPRLALERVLKPEE
jgi:hypothetical protein